MINLRCIKFRKTFLSIFALLLSLQSEANTESGKISGLKKTLSDTLFPGSTIKFEVLEESDPKISPNDDIYVRTSVDSGKNFSDLRRMKKGPLVVNGNSLTPESSDVFFRNMKPIDRSLLQNGSLYLVEFHTNPRKELRDYLISSGYDVKGFIPPHALIIKSDSQKIGGLSSIASLKNIMEYKPEIKINPQLAAQIANNRKGKSGVSKAEKQTTKIKQRYLVVLFSADNDSLVDFEHFMIKNNIKTEKKLTSKSRFIHMNLTEEELSTILTSPQVQSVDIWSPPESDLDIVREAGGYNLIESEVPFYTGLGVVGSIVDAGFDMSHPNFSTGAVTYRGNKCRESDNGAVVKGTDVSTGKALNTYLGGHGTQVMGILFGTGLDKSAARGLLPDARAYFTRHDYVTCPKPYDRTLDIEETVDTNGSIRAVFQSNSWGSATHTLYYNAQAQELDQAIFDNDLLVLQSQGNKGSQLSRPEAWAKNIISVGGVVHKNTASTDDDVFSVSTQDTTSSFGPSESGRIKPDLIHFRDAILTTYPTQSINVSGNFEKSESFYSQFSGTSASTPITAGHFGLMFQMWNDGIFNGTGIPGGGQTNKVFENRPKSSTAKALIINSAKQYTLTNSDESFSRGKQGWGLSNIGNLFQIAKNNNWKLPILINETLYLKDQEKNTFSLKVSGDSLPYIKTTLVYKDPPTASDNVTNDLSLKVTSPSGVVYWGNWGLTTSNWSTPGGFPDSANNVENVFIEKAESGLWSIAVQANRITLDAVKDTDETDASYALVVTCGGNNCIEYNSPPTQDTSYLSWLVPVINLLSY